jgi:hypothetical protein
MRSTPEIQQAMRERQFVEGARTTALEGQSQSTPATQLKDSLKPLFITIGALSALWLLLMALSLEKQQPPRSPQTASVASGAGANVKPDLRAGPVSCDGVYNSHIQLTTPTPTLFVRFQGRKPGPAALKSLAHACARSVGTRFRIQGDDLLTVASWRATTNDKERDLARWGYSPLLDGFLERK